MALSSTLAARQRAANWRSWDGRGACPVKAAEQVSVMLRNGHVLTGRASDWQWSYEQGPDLGDDPEEIVAYRVRSAWLVQLRRRAA